MNTMKNQRGVTGLGWLIILSLIAFFAFLALKLFPIFVENFNVKTALKSLKSEAGIEKKSFLKIRGLLIRKLDINDVKNVGAKDIKVNKRKGKLYVTVKYTVKQPLTGPLSLVADFEERMETE